MKNSARKLNFNNLTRLILVLFALSLMACESKTEDEVKCEGELSCICDQAATSSPDCTHYVSGWSVNGAQESCASKDEPGVFSSSALCPDTGFAGKCRSSLFGGASVTDTYYDDSAMGQAVCGLLGGTWTNL